MAEPSFMRRLVVQVGLGLRTTRYLSSSVYLTARSSRFSIYSSAESTRSVRVETPLESEETSALS